MGEQSALEKLIRRARLRHASQIILNQAIFAFVVVLGGLIALLLFGTQFLNWFWLAGLFGVALCLGLYRAKGRFRSEYQLAQRLDARLALNDELSTALYFSDRAASVHFSPEVIEQQRASAEAAARSADLKTGLPFHMPKSVYAGAGLALIAASIFAVRYGVTRSLDLRTSLVQIAFNGLMGSDEIAAAKKKGSPAKPGSNRPIENALTVDPWESKALDQQGAPESALNTVETPDVNNPNYNTESNAKANGTPSQDPVQQPGEASSEGDKSAPGSDQNPDNASAQNKDGSKQGKQQGGEQQDKAGNGSGENSSLADKMRDALSNLMSKLKPQSKQNEGKQNGQQSQGQQSAQRQGKDEKGSQQQGKQSDATSSPDQQGDQEGQSSDKAASAQNKSGNKSSDRPPSQDGKSGVGKEDGDKSAREAEQLAAMGKISEIIGKRQQNMTGEVMVEVSSGKQQLKTQYSQRKAAHTDAGGDMNRDEVPLAYQQFVQQYFEEIRKAPATPAGQSKAKKTPGS